MSEKEKYLKFARRCIEMQKRAAVPDERLLLIEMAQTWRELARRDAKEPADTMDGPKESGVIG